MPPRITFSVGRLRESPGVTLYENFKHLCLVATGRSDGDNNCPMVVDP